VFVLAHWITDRDLPRRFDVPFLVARMPEGQEPVADESEQFEPVWVRPAEALTRHEAGQIFHDFPDHSHPPAHEGLCHGGAGAAGLRPEARCGPLARAPDFGRAKKRATWSMKRRYGELAMVCARRANAAPPGLADRPARSCS
jgi:recombination protein RecT